MKSEVKEWKNKYSLISLKTNPVGIIHELSLLFIFPIPYSLFPNNLIISKVPRSYIINNPKAINTNGTKALP
jgi:hypothetical protein